jgi:DNA-binding PadR family transcriptional regulator
MVQLLILYYLSLKATHGYEIQKFIQLNHMDEWNNIKSGSIYYAMSKLERDGLIALVKRVGEGEKTKCIYSITEKGIVRLREMALTELNKPLGSILSEKFLVYPIVANLTKDEILSSINSHVIELQAKRQDIDSWYIEKYNTATNVEKATLNLMKESVEGQIKWHSILAENIDETISAVEKITQIIRSTDFSERER